MMVRNYLLVFSRVNFTRFFCFLEIKINDQKVDRKVGKKRVKVRVLVTLEDNIGCYTFGPKRIWSPDIWSPTMGPQLIGPLYSVQTVPNQFGPHGQTVPKNLVPLKSDYNS